MFSPGNKLSQLCDTEAGTTHSVPASLLLDRVLARASSLNSKLDRLSATASGRASLRTSRMQLQQLEQGTASSKKAEQSADGDRNHAINQTAGHPTNQTAGHSTNMTADYSTVQSAVQPGVLLDICLARASTLHETLDKLSAKVSGRRKSTDGDGADQSDDQLEEYRLAPTNNLPAQPAENDSTNSAQVARDPMNRLGQHAGNVSSSLPPASLQVNVINNEANDMAHYSPLDNADHDADHSGGQGSTDQNPTREASTIQVVTATDYSAQLAGVTIGQPANLADEDSSAKKADTIKVVTATDSTAQLAEVTIGQHAYLANDSSAQKADTILTIKMDTATDSPAQLSGVTIKQHAYCISCR